MNIMCRRVRPPRLGPPSFGPFPIRSWTFVASTTSWRRPLRALPTYSSEDSRSVQGGTPGRSYRAWLPYELAVSMKLMPRSSARPTRASTSAASGAMPKRDAPTHNADTRTPEAPSSRYSMSPFLAPRFSLPVSRSPFLVPRSRRQRAYSSRSAPTYGLTADLPARSDPLVSDLHSEARRVAGHDEAILGHGYPGDALQLSQRDADGSTDVELAHRRLG